MNGQDTTVSVALSAGQRAEFVALDQQEAQAKKLLEEIPLVRTHAARAVVLAQYSPEQISGQSLTIDLSESGIITLALNPVE